MTLRRQIQNKLTWDTGVAYTWVQSINSVENVYSLSDGLKAQQHNSPSPDPRVLTLTKPIIKTK